jgi:hypothetical protein
MTDIFTTLAFKGCVCIPREEDRRVGLANFCAEKAVTLALITPSLASFSFLDGGFLAPAVQFGLDQLLHLLTSCIGSLSYLVFRRSQASCGRVV